jgi:sulfur transfer complex TusBCD TusB component (DsrH family)
VKQLNRIVGCLLLGLSAATLACAQRPPVPVESNTAHVKLGQSTVALNGPWKFSIGDSPKDSSNGDFLWAEPAFDDSKWETVDLSSGTGEVDPINGMSGYAPGWTMRGHAGYWGYAWYRIRVQLDALPGEKLALSGPADIDDVYQAYANGLLLGSFGGFSSARPVSYYSQPKMFLLPSVDSLSGTSTGSDSPAANGKVTMVIAFRVWMEPNSLVSQPDAGGFHTAPVLGEAGSVTAGYQLRWLELVRAYVVRFFEGLLYGILTLVVLSLMLFNRDDRVYLWITAVFFLLAANNIMTGIGAWTQWVTYVLPQFLRDVVLVPLIFAGWVMVWFVWFGLRKPSWIPSLTGVLLILLMITNTAGGDLFFTIVPHPVASFCHVASLLIRLAFLFLICCIVVLGTKRNGIEGFLVMPAVLLLGISSFNAELGVLHIRLNWFPFGVQFGMGSLANLLLVGGLAVLVFRRLMNSVREQRRMALDVKQAQEVQQVILPQARSIYPGLAIESEYRPAREVGGDFFQIIPNNRTGSMVIVAGDVTGKGLKAGMLVALLVGAIRSTVELNPEPEFIVKALNRRLLGRGDSQATCLAMRIDEDGMVTLANAGHMPPYLNGQPVSIEGSLPLGILPEADCTILCFRLEEGDRLVLLSDGIAEATDHNGALFGFERVHSMLQTRLSASEIANTAQLFGQEDDISVISVTRMATLTTARA